MEQKHPLLSKEDKEKAAIDRHAIKADYKKWKDTLSGVDIVNHLKTCYNTYEKLSRDISLPKDIRISYIDRVAAYKDILDYIERQA